MDPRIKLFADCRCILSESPMWHKKTNRLYWRGFNGEIYRKSVNDNVADFECFSLDIGMIGSMVFTDSDDILLFGEHAKIWKWKPGKTPVLHKNFQKNLFNDVVCDPKGRIYCGMLTENYFIPSRRGEYGSFWLLDDTGNFQCLENNIGITPNGIRFSPQLDKLYFAVTDDQCIYQYDYDVKTGALSNKEVFVTGCSPDGIAVDAAGNLWVANCMPGKPLLCYTPKGELIDEIYFPVYRIISVGFGGPDNKLLFVTTASEHKAVGPHDGGVFIVESAVPGADEYILYGRNLL